MNTLWATYGCTKCDAYEVLVITCNWADSKSSFKSEFIDKLGVKTLCVSKDEGGKALCDAVKNGNSGGPTYLIKPDKTFKGMSASEADIKAAGIKPHVCKTSIVNNNLSQINSMQCWLQKDYLTLKNPVGDAYSITLYSSNGDKKIVSSSQYYSVGSHRINLNELSLAKGFYLVEIKSSTSVIRQKAIVE